MIYAQEKFVIRKKKLQESYASIRFESESKKLSHLCAIENGLKCFVAVPPKELKFLVEDVQLLYNWDFFTAWNHVLQKLIRVLRHAEANSSRVRISLLNYLNPVIKLIEKMHTAEELFAFAINRRSELLPHGEAVADYGDQIGRAIIRKLMLNQFGRCYVPSREGPKGFLESGIIKSAPSGPIRITDCHVACLYFVWRQRRLNWYKVRELMKSRQETFFQENYDIIVEETSKWPERARRYIYKQAEKIEKPAQKEKSSQATPSQVAATMKDSLFFYDPEDDSDADEAVGENEETNTALVREEMSQYETCFSRKKDEKWRTENRSEINEESHVLNKFWREHKQRFPLMSQIALKVRSFFCVKINLL